MENIFTSEDEISHITHYAVKHFYRIMKVIEIKLNHSIGYDSLDILEAGLKSLKYKHLIDYTLRVDVTPLTVYGEYADYNYYLQIHNNKMMQDTKVKEILLEYLI